MKKADKKHPSLATGKTGILLVNLGTPSALDYFSLRRYLHEFLMDPRVVEMNRAAWWAILNIILLSFIPFRSRKNYTKIWDHEKNESPLLQITRAQAESLEERLGNDTCMVDFAMRYGQPSIQSKLTHLKQQGCERILVVPLYPQYSAVTSGSVCDATFDALKRMRWMPTLRIAPPYHDHPAYIDAISQSITNHVSAEELSNAYVVFSYHGIPQRYFDNGDPYPCHCFKTTRLAAEKLGLSKENYTSAFQSRFGREEWVKPYLDAKLEELPHQGHKRLIVLTPGFAADCVETLEEIAIRSKEAFLEAGGEHFTAIPCLNASPHGIDMLQTCITQELSGWPTGMTAQKKKAS